MREAHSSPAPGREPQPGVETVVVRPPAGMARGAIAVSPAVVVLLTLALLLVTLGYYSLRLRGARRR